jgi:hypothetical protein
VTNTDAVIALVRAHASTTRVFTFGIGHGASRHLVQGIARAGGGAAEFIQPGERIEAKVLRQFQRLLSPALTDVKVAWGNAAVTQAPRDVPPVFAGGRVLVYGLLGAPADLEVALSMSTSSGPRSFTVASPIGDARPGRTVGTLAARALIRDLEESPAWLSARGSKQRERRQSQVSQEIVRLSTMYGVVSRETSFVAIERRERPVEGEAQLRRVPVAITHAWGGIDSDARTWEYASFHAPRAPGASRSAAATLNPMSMIDGAVAWTAGAVDSLRTGLRSVGGVPPKAASPVSSADARRPIDALVALQGADGSWPLTEALAAVLGAHLRDLVEMLPENERHVDERRRALATVLALAWLRREASAHEDEWRLLARKAERWLDGNHVAAGTRAGWEARLASSNG